MEPVDCTNKEFGVLARRCIILKSIPKKKANNERNCEQKHFWNSRGYNHFTINGSYRPKSDGNVGDVV